MAVKDWVPYQQQAGEEAAAMQAKMLHDAGQSRLDAFLKNQLAQKQAEQEQAQMQNDMQMAEVLRQKYGEDTPITSGKVHIGSPQRDPNDSLKMWLLKDQYEEQKKKKSAEIPGLKIQSPTTPSEDDVKKAKDAFSAYGALEGAAKTANEATQGLSFIDKLMPTAKSNDAKQAVEGIALQLKNLEQLGALSGPDMDILKRKMGALSSAGKLGQFFYKDEDIQKSLQNVLDDARQRAEKNLAIRGYSMQNPMLALNRSGHKTIANEESKYPNTMIGKDGKIYKHIGNGKYE